MTVKDVVKEFGNKFYIRVVDDENDIDTYVSTFNFVDRTYDDMQVFAMRYEQYTLNVPVMGCEDYEQRLMVGIVCTI